MIQPQPFKYVCPKCGYSKIVKPKSDVINPMDMISVCPKCQTKMEKKAMNIFDNITSILK
jgi:DNA polymerase III alpha subunit (gram-positive type)